MRTATRLSLGILAFLSLAITLPAQATEPDSERVATPQYNAFELRENLGTTPLIPSDNADETISFNVNVDEEGEVSSLRYSHNITDQATETLDAYIRQAYQAILDTEFKPAMKDGKAVASTVKIDFYILD